MANVSAPGPVLQIEGFLLSKVWTYVAFSFFFLVYVFIMAANVSMAVLIACDRSLQQPMYLLYANLALNDLAGNSSILPRLLVDLLRPPGLRLIHLYECVIQAFFVHFCSTASHTILTIMAFDRYVAICDPLRYSAIMTKAMLIKLTVSAWGSAFVLVGVLIGLSLRLTRCRSYIAGIYCTNPSLFKLSCEATNVNNVYGLVFTALVFSSSMGSVVLTYSKITLVCLMSNSKSLNRKALQTCCSHLVVYLVMVVTGMMIITLHRFPVLVEERKVLALLKDIVPGSLNPVIYGLQSKHIRQYLRSKKVFTSS